MSNTCGGLDNTVPDEIAEAMKGYIKTHPKKRRDYLDAPDCCLLEDLDGKRCPHGKCQYNDDGNPTPNYTPHKKI
jgi:hypothetical protein